MTPRTAGRRGALLLIGSLLLLAAMPAPADAYWATTDSSQSARATAATLPPGATPSSVSSSGRTVLVSFARAVSSAAAGSLTLASYQLHRYPAGAPAEAKPAATLTCNSTDGPLASCLDEQVPDGSWSYSDAPVLANWSGPDSARSVAVTVDGTRPAPTISSPANGSFSNDSTPTISGNASTGHGDLALVTVQVFTGQASTGSALQTWTVAAGQGPWTVTASELAGNASYTVVASQRDSAGNIGQASSTFVLDTTAPAISLNPLSGTVAGIPQLSGEAGTVSASATSSADSDSVNVAIYAGSRVSTSPLQRLVTPLSGGSWAVTGQRLPTGSYTAQAEFSDGAGNVSYSTPRTFTVDTSAPAVTVTSPSNGCATEDRTPTVTGTAGLALGDLSTVRVSVYAGASASGTPLQSLTTTAGLGWWSVQLGALAPNQRYTVRASQADAYGNVGLASSTFVLDTIGPRVSLSSPAPGSVHAATPSFSGLAGTVAGSATSSADARTVTVRVYSGTSASGEPVRTLTANVTGGSYRVTGAALGSGSYTAQASQRDAAGNVSLSASSTFTVDASPPAVSLASIAGFTVDRTPTFAGTAGTAAGDLAAVTVRIYPGSSASGSPLQVLPAVRNGASWSATAAALAANAQYTVQASQLDGTGNLGLSAARTFTVDTAAPANLAISAPRAGGTEVGTTPTLTGTAGDAVRSASSSADDSTVTVRIYQGGTLDQCLVPAVGAGGSWSVRIASGNRLMAGQRYTVVVSQSDELGNTASSLPISFTA